MKHPTISPIPPERISLAGVVGIRELPVHASFGQRAIGQVFTTGRNARGQFANWNRVTLRVTSRGHWYRSDDERDGFHNDTVCRGCGHHGHFDYILDNKACSSPATAMDVARALLPAGTDARQDFELSQPEHSGHPGLVAA